MKTILNDIKIEVSADFKEIDFSHTSISEDETLKLVQDWMELKSVLTIEQFEGVKNLIEKAVYVMGRNWD